MPPKTAADTEDDGKGVEVISLCHVIMSCGDFKCDNNYLAPILGVAQARNVPRKINAIINPHGFELKAGKIVRKDGSTAGPAPSVQAKKPATPKKAASTTPKTPASKKRKVKAVEASTAESTVEPAVEPATESTAESTADEGDPMMGAEVLDAIERGLSYENDTDMDEMPYGQDLD